MSLLTQVKILQGDESIRYSGYEPSDSGYRLVFDFHGTRRRLSKVAKQINAVCVKGGIPLFVKTNKNSEMFEYDSRGSLVFVTITRKNLPIWKSKNPRTTQMRTDASIDEVVKLVLARIDSATIKGRPNHRVTRAPKASRSRRIRRPQLIFSK